jgi:HSP20 family protein
MTLVKFNHQTNPTINNLLDNFFATDVLDFLGGKQMHNLVPAVNIKEMPEAYLLELAAPGYKKDNFSIKQEENRLVISAEVKSDNEEKTDGYSRREFSCSSFSKSFTLPEDANAESIKARYENGVLLVEIAKNEVKSNPARQIEIE